MQPACDGLEILLHRRVEFHGALGRRAHDNFLHVAIRSVQQTALFARRQHRDRAAPARGAEVSALQRVHRDIHGHAVRSPGTHPLADEQHGRFVALTLTDDDGPFDRQRVQAAAHRFHGGLVGEVGVAHSHGAGRRDRGAFNYSE